MAKKRKQQIINLSRRSGRTMNKIELVIFGAMTIYIVVLIVMYMKSDPIRGYEIQLGSLSVAKNYTGIAIRDEQILNTPYTGYINFYIREGERVSTSDTVYSIDASGKLAELLDTGESDDNSYTDEELSDFRASVIQYDSGFKKEDFNSIYDFKYDVEGSVMKLVNLNMYNNMENLTNSSLSGMVNLCTAGQSGYIVYNTDGFETLKPEQITADMFDTGKYEKTRVNNNDLVEAKTPIGKLVTDENWSIVIPIEEDKAKELEEAGYVKVKFIKNQENSWASVKILNLDDGTYAQLTFNNSCMPFCTDRFIDIELVLNDEKGLKIPNSAIAEKEFFIIPAEYMIKGGENGEYGVSKEFFDENGNPVYKYVETTVYNSDENEFYVDNTNLSVGDYICKPDSTDKMAISKSGKLIGVYNMNKGYADFKQITILYQNDEYSIVSSNTKYGLTVYDRIVLDASSVDNDQFIYK